MSVRSYDTFPRVEIEVALLGVVALEIKVMKRNTPVKLVVILLDGVLSMTADMAVTLGDTVVKPMDVAVTFRDTVVMPVDIPGHLGTQR